MSAWAAALAAWAVPEEILAGAVDSPWVLPRQVFTRRADARIVAPVGETYAAAVAALTKPGTVLDVGAAGGATSLPLLGRAPVRALTGVDADAELLAAFAARAEKLGLPAKVYCGRWPEVADDVPVADIVLCGNVVYNVADLGPFVAALTAHARRLVVIETAASHPLTELNPLWARFHGIDRPTGPTADDLVVALGELGIRPAVARWRRAPEAEYADFAELVDVTRRRLCLPPNAATEVAEALMDMGVDPELPPDLGSSGHELVTMTWPGAEEHSTAAPRLDPVN